ncbi:hypothetical protein FE783_21030 [Paenibacillus mesophilus]|uniref:Kelch repeat-containing protein n=1 Tax=Paenibacillus mesophilus TaxID=2582849 RepID=UPI00110E5F2E|nr:kelch repeat-containing protein [Paenibacillus mesophilus]TMV47488.1 hypothetical protein FE783_21030 [Paenibacillus mesophilus]
MQQAKRSCIFFLMFISIFLTLLAAQASAAENEWELISPLPTPRTGVQVVEVGGKIYAIGGSNNSGALSVVEQFDPMTNNWTAKQSMNSIKSNTFAAAALNNKIYAFSGTAVEEYNPSTNTWTVKGPIPKAVTNPSAAALNGKIYVFSGVFVQEYDPANDTWSAKNNSAINLSGTAAVSLNGKIYVLGGTYEGQFGYLYSSKRSLVYDPAADQWANLANMKIERTQFGAEAVNGKIYVFGGDTYYRHSIPTREVECYDPATNAWTSMKQIPAALAGHDTVLLGNRIYVAGGIQNDLVYYGYAQASYVYSAPSPSGQLEPPTGVTAVVYESGVTIKWAPVLNATGYSIKRSDQLEGPYTQIGTVASSTYGNTVTSATYTYSDTGPFTRAYYYYTVSAVNSAGESDYSNKVLAILPPAIENIQSTPTGIAITWTPFPEAIKYTIKRSTTPGGPYTTVGTVDSGPWMYRSLFFDESNLQLGVTYYYIVSMTTSVGESTSKEISGALQSVKPTNLVAAVQSSQISLTWVRAYEAQTYTVKRATKSGGPYSTIASGITATSYTDTNVQPGVTYYYVVTAIGMGHESDSSNEASALIPSSSSSGGILKITMEEGNIKMYQLDSAKLNAFVDWFETRARGIGPDAFGLDKGPDGSYSSMKHYILYNRIITFEVNMFKP